MLNMTILALMARMTLMIRISVNVIASTIMRVAILDTLFIVPDIDMVIMAAAAITDGHIGCYEYIVVLTKHSQDV